MPKEEDGEASDVPIVPSDVLCGLRSGYFDVVMSNQGHWFGLVLFSQYMCHVSQESGQMNRNRSVASPPSPVCHHVSSDLPGPTLRAGGGKKRTERAGSSLTS